MASLRDRNAALFDGVDDKLTLSNTHVNNLSTAPYSWYCVYQLSALSDCSPFGALGGYGFVVDNTNGRFGIYHAGTLYYTASGYVHDLSTNVVVGRFTGSHIELWLNNVLILKVAATGVGFANGLYVGARPNMPSLAMNGYIGAIGIQAASISDNQIDGLSRYLKTHWGA